MIIAVVIKFEVIIIIIIIIIIVITSTIDFLLIHPLQALSLDDGEVYRDRLQVALHRLELRAELYQTPEREEDQAAMVIEQARKADSGTMRMKRSLLVRAGQMLAPDAFLLVLDSENDTKGNRSSSL